MARQGAAAHRPDILTAQLVAEYRAGDSTRTIGERHGISHTAVADRLEEAGESRRKGPSFKMRVCAGCGCSFRPKWPEQTLCKPECKGGKHGTICKKGLHLLTPENLTPRYGHAGSRCRTCMYLAQAQYHARKKGN